MGLSSNLTWYKHIAEKTNKAIRTLMALKAMVGRTWGLNPSKAKWVYTAIARPIITYGSILWASGPVAKNVKHLFNRIQRLAGLMISGGVKSMPTAGLEVIEGLIPIELLATELAAKSRVRSREWLQVTWDGLGRTGKGHQRKLDDIISKSTNADNIAMELWKKQWQNLATCRQTKLFLPEPDLAVSKHLISMNRPNLCLLVQFYTGHTLLKSHLCKMGVISDPVCRLCVEDDETASHIAFECPALECIRREYNLCNSEVRFSLEWHQSLCAFLLRDNVRRLTTERIENDEF